MVNLTKIEFKKTKSGYLIFYKKKKLSLNVPTCKLPFGVEEYKDTYVANLEWRKKKELKNNLDRLSKLLTDIIEKMKLDTFKEDSYIYYNPIKVEEHTIKLRTKLKSYVKFFDKDDESCRTIYDLGKNENINCKIVVDSIWIHDNKIGFNIYISYITVI